MINSTDKDSTGPALSINDKVSPEFDISHVFSPQPAVELVLACLQKQTL